MGDRIPITIEATVIEERMRIVGTDNHVDPVSYLVKKDPINIIANNNIKMDTDREDNIDFRITVFVEVSEEKRVVLFGNLEVNKDVAFIFEVNKKNVRCNVV